jgi:carbamoyl-phosphate synthase large subunit
MQLLQKRPPWSVLVFPGGTEIGLEINRALRDCKEVILYSAGQPVPSAAEFRFKRHFDLPSIHDPRCLEMLNSAVESYGIDVICPAHDDVVFGLTAARSAVNATVISSPTATCAICRSKVETYRLLASTVPVPALFAQGDEIAFPVFVKPDRGQGSARARRIDDLISLRRALATEPDLIVCEYLPGKEFTVDCFSDRKQGLLFHSSRERIRIRAGIAMQSRLIKHEQLSSMATAIASKLELYGAWFFQAKGTSSGQLKLLEVAPRVSGTMALSRVLGVNFPLLSIFEAGGYAISIEAFDADIEISRSLDNYYRYDRDYSAVYIDLDDTLILRGAVNTRVMRLVYQCINRGIPVRLLTRHGGVLPEILKGHRLSGIFDEVIHLANRASKGDAVREPDAILIDDSFRERSSVARTRGIRTFDVSAIECLLDDRE